MSKRTDTGVAPAAMKRLGLCVAALGVGIAGLIGLTSMKKPPAVKVIEERVLTVEGKHVEPEDHAVVITGYGTAVPLNVVELSPEVAGRVVEVHPNLEVGQVIPAGEVLFGIDPSDYRVARDEAAAETAARRAAIERLQTQAGADGERLAILERSRELARREFERLRELLESSRVGTRSAVEAAERASHAASDQAALLARATALYPAQIREARSALQAAEARLARAELNLRRCRVSVPFAARVKTVAIEPEQVVAPGRHVLTLADDARLELHVPLDSRDARRWLRFEGGEAGADGGVAWFERLQPVACEVRWTEAPRGQAWTGVLHRVVRVEPETRALVVAVQVSASQARLAAGGSLPLVEGMFCEVSIPGRTMAGLYRLPRWAVSFENTVHLSVAGRLRTVPVEVARVQGDEAFIEGGLAPGDLVVTTRLANPLENSRLTVRLTGEDAGP